MDTKHTPGPWEFVREDGDRQIVAPTLSPTLRTRETLMSDTTYYPWCPASDDDWRLIATAPEMFAALVEAVECGMVPISSAEEGGAMRHSRQVRCADMIRAAIAKATGATP